MRQFTPSPVAVRRCFVAIGVVTLALFGIALARTGSGRPAVHFWMCDRDGRRVYDRPGGQPLSDWTVEDLQLDRVTISAPSSPWTRAGVAVGALKEHLVVTVVFARRVSDAGTEADWHEFVLEHGAGSMFMECVRVDSRVVGSWDSPDGPIELRSDGVVDSVVLGGDRRWGCIDDVLCFYDTGTSPDWMVIGGLTIAPDWSSMTDADGKRYRRRIR